MITDTDDNTKIKKIAFLGGAAWKPDELPYIGAFETAKLLAEHDYEIINGGGPGVMEASTKGAHAAGKDAFAITYHPSAPKPHYEGVAHDNDFDFEVVTLDYFDRTKVMLQTSDAHIFFNGSIGTMSELGMTWISSWIHYPKNRPIVLFGDFWNEYIRYMKDYMLLGKGEEEMMKIVHSADEVLEYLEELNIK